MLINNLLIEHARHQPTKAAVITNERSITYGELDLAVNCHVTPKKRRQNCL